MLVILIPHCGEYKNMETINKYSNPIYMSLDEIKNWYKTICDEWEMNLSKYGVHTRFGDDLERLPECTQDGQTEN